VSETASAPTRPYPGLRPFKREETDLFFGREDCVDLLIDILAQQRFLAVLGSSGSGKSSLVKTGLLNGLELGFMQMAGAKWRILDLRPEDSPIRNLAHALLQGSGRQGSREDLESLRTFLTRGPRSIIEW
jgi:hypothetical protein